MKPEIPYRDLRFPPATAPRPYTIIDMVATIDGKIVSGDRGEDVGDLGSNIDHAVMRHLEDLVDGVLIGAGTLRATPKGWDPKTSYRVVLSNSGRVDTSHTFFAGPGAYVAVPAAADFQSANGVEPLVAGASKVNPAEISRKLREMGCQRLLILGGSTTNGSFLQADLVDEIFLTVAPKVKLGVGVPTVAEGVAFGRDELPQFELLEHHAVGDEIFLRYRRGGKR